MTIAGQPLRIAVAATAAGIALSGCASRTQVAQRSAIGSRTVAPILTSNVASASPTSAPLASPIAPASESFAAITVPWVDRPAPPYVDPSPSPLPTNARPCHAADLRVSLGDGGVAMSNVKLPVLFTNKSATTCVLFGYPTLAGITTSGRIVALHPQHGSYFGEPGPASNIAPGATAVVFVGWLVPNTTAQPAPPYRQLRISLPAGGAVDVAASGLIASGGVWVTDFGVPALQPPPAPEPPASPLVVRIDAPATMRPGETLEYTVTLTNPTSMAYALQPCPSYTEFVGSGAQTWVATVDDYYLNCDTVHAVAAHSSVTYEMRLAVPSNQPLSNSPKFGWDFQGISAAGTSTQIAVVS
jgi:hypothetical protein